MSNEMTGKELTQIGTEMFGVKWKKPLADMIGMSAARMYQLSVMTDCIPQRAAGSVELAYDAWRKENGRGVDTSDEQVSDEEISSRVAHRMKVMNQMVHAMIEGEIRSMIIYGAPGIGKTYDIERALEQAQDASGLEYFFIRGTASASGLYTALFHARNGGVVVIDDSDTIFDDEESFNLLKGALDTTDRRVLSWRKKSSWVYPVDGLAEVEIEQKAEENEGLSDLIPNRFEFRGGAIFITNIDFQERIARGNKLGNHFKALMSRSLYLDLTLTSLRSRLIRIHDVFTSTMADKNGVEPHEAEEILDFVVEHANDFIELSLRTVKHICTLYRMDDWKEIVKLTKMKPSVTAIE